MTDNNPLKSSFELAMERLKKQDSEQGVAAVPLTDAQKAAIADVRMMFDAKIAEQDILQQSAMRNLGGADPADVDEISRQFRRERERLAGERDAKIEAIRRGTSGQA